MDDAAILSLRLTLGIVMIAHGVVKFLRKQEFDKKWLEHYDLPVGSVLFNGVLQVVGGVCLAVGIFSRVISLILIVDMLVATYVSIWKQAQPFLSGPEGKGWDINFLMIGGLLAQFFLGDGRWSLAEWWLKMN